MKSQAGFTLIEIMVVLIIIAGLIAVVAPNFIKIGDDAKIDITKAKIDSVETALKLFKLHNGFYPETQQGMKALVEIPGTGREAKKWKGPYLEDSKLPLDGWDNEFLYIGPDQTGDGLYEVRSSGQDAIANNDDDISSRDD